MEQRSQGVLLQLGADDAQTAGDTSSAITDLHLTGNIVKVQPLAVRTGYNALGPQHLAVVAGIQGFQRGSQLLLPVGVGGLFTPAGKYLIGMVMMVMVVMFMAAAAALIVIVILIVMVVMLMLVVMVMVLSLIHI